MRNIFNFDEILKSRDEYLKVKKELSKDLLDNYSMRKMLVKVIINSESFDATAGYVMINLFLINSFVGQKIQLTKEDLFNAPTVTQKLLQEYFNNILEKYASSGIKDLDIVRETIYQTLNEMSDVSGEYNVLSGNSISYTDFVKLSVNDPEAYALFHPVVKEGQYSEIEKQFKNHGKKLINYFETHEETELYPFVASETGINTKQLVQCIGFVGLKPDITGNVIPVTIEDNFLNGLKGIESYFINCKGTRLALRYLLK